MASYQITLTVEESSQSMAHQLLALAIKKKFKSKIRPHFQIYTDDGLQDVTSIRLQNQLWRDKAGLIYDY